MRGCGSRRLFIKAFCQVYFALSLLSCASTAPTSGPFAGNLKDGLRFILIADLDRNARTDKGFHSYVKRGLLIPESGPSDKLQLKWLDSGPGKEILTKLNDGTRGGEFSELIWYRGQLLTPDDRTGIVYEIQKPWAGLQGDDDSPSLAMRYCLAGGDGRSAHGFKAEWAAVMDNSLVFGGHGREFTDGKNPPKVLSRDNLWVKRIQAKDSAVWHEDWTEIFKALREAAGLDFPGYLEHEAFTYSDERQEWIVLPRRFSREAYDEKQNQNRGWNKALISNANFTRVQIVELDVDPIPARGFSAVKVVPGTGGDWIGALRTEEDEKLGTFASYLSIFSLKEKRALVRDAWLGPVKYEGLEFLPIPNP